MSLWDWTNPSPLARFTDLHGASVTCMIPLPDGRFITGTLFLSHITLLIVWNVFYFVSVSPCSEHLNLFSVICFLHRFCRFG